MTTIYEDYEIDNRDKTVTWLHIKDVGTVSVDPLDLFYNSIENNHSEDKEVMKRLDEFVEYLKTI